MKITELALAVEGQRALIPFPETKKHQGVEGARAPPKEDDKLSPGVEQESTPLVFVDTGATMEEQEVKGHEFPKVEIRIGLLGVHCEAGGGDGQDGGGRPGPRC